MRRLNASERALFRRVAEDAGALDADLNQRFINALLVMARDYPGWMMWVEVNLPRRVDDLYKDGQFRMFLQLVESVMRWRFFKPHSFFGRNVISEIVFNEHYVFTERGSLRMW